MKLITIAVLLAGGKGTRLASSVPKQFIEVNRRMIISFSLETLLKHAGIDGVWIVCEEAWRDQVRNEIRRLQLPMKKLLGFSLPGERSRQESIRNALRDFFKISPTYVLIHDAARPNLSSKMIDDCLEALKTHDGVMPVLPMKDTVYYSENGQQVSRLLERDRIFCGQAPEAYDFKKYYAANEALSLEDISKVRGSTEPAVMAGIDIVMIPGDERNFKITTAEDLDRFREQFR
jgi:2-C-methyl-D-erythritol 4-phosphate cytidylyltransferase